MDWLRRLFSYRLTPKTDVPFGDSDRLTVIEMVIIVGLAVGLIALLGVACRYLVCPLP